MLSDKKFMMFNLRIGIIFCILAVYIRYIHGEVTLHDYLIKSGALDFQGRDNLVHFFCGIGFPGFLYLIANWFLSLKACKKINSLFLSSLLAGIFYVLGQILWEFFDERNTANQFLYDCIGVFIYIVAASIYAKKIKLSNYRKQA